MTPEEIAWQARFKAANAVTCMGDAMDAAIVRNSETLKSENLHPETRKFLEGRIKEQKEEAAALRLIAREIMA